MALPSRDCKEEQVKKQREVKTNTAILIPEDLPTRYLFRNRIQKAYTDQTRCYYVASGVTLTALGTTNSNAARIAITVLGAVNTPIAGSLTFLKSRNQPNRALQFRNGLRGVYEEISFGNDHEKINVNAKVDQLREKYKEVRAEVSALSVLHHARGARQVYFLYLCFERALSPFEVGPGQFECLLTSFLQAEANYPGLCVSLSRLTKSHDVDKNPSPQLDDVRVTDDDDDDDDDAHDAPDRASGGHEPLLP